MSYIVSSGRVSRGVSLDYYSGMTVLDGGTATKTTVNDGNWMYVYGTATETTVNDGSYLCVYGTATATTVNSGGDMYVRSGGTATATTVNDGGNLYVSSGGTATATTVNSGGDMYVRSGGTATATTVNSGGSMSVFSGGMVMGTTVNSRGYMSVSSGGTALQIKENGGYVNVKNGVDVTFVANMFSGLVLSDYQSATVHSGTTATGTTVNCDGDMFVSSGGLATDTTVNCDGDMFVSSGGLATDTTVNSGGSMYVSSGGTATVTTVNSGYLDIFAGGTATTTTVNSGGSMYVSSGGTAIDTTVNSYGYLSVSSGGTALRIKENGGYVSVADGANITFVANVLNGLNVSWNMTVHSGTTATGTTVNSGGDMHVRSGGTAVDTFVASGGRFVFTRDWGRDADIRNLQIAVGGALSFEKNDEHIWIQQGDKTAVIDDGVSSDWNGLSVSGSVRHLNLQRDDGWNGFQIHIVSGGTAIDTIVNGDLYVFSGGTATGTTVNVNGDLYVSSGGTATDTTVNDCGRITVFKDGIAINTVVNGDREYGWLTISFGGFATATTLECHGQMTVLDGGTATSTTVNSGGGMTISSGGTAIDTIVNGDEDDYWHGESRGLCVYFGGVASNTTVNSGGRMMVSGGTAVDTLVASGGRFICALDWGRDTDIRNLQLAVGGVLSFENNDRYWIQQGDKTAVIDGGVSSDWNGLSVSGSVEHLNLKNERDWENVSIIIVSGGTAVDTAVNSNGGMTISSGGTATETTVNFGGDMTISSGGTAIDTIVNGDGDDYRYWHDESRGLCVYSGGVASNTTVNSGGRMMVSGGTAVDTLVASDGRFVCALDWGRDTDIRNLQLAVGGALSFEKNDRDYWIQQGDKTAVIDGVLSSDGNGFRVSGSIDGLNLDMSNYSLPYGSAMMIEIVSGGTATDSVIGKNMRLVLSSGASANSIELVDNGIRATTGYPLYLGMISAGMIVESGAVAEEITADLADVIGVASGGTLTRLRENGGCVILENGANVEFEENTISGLVLPGFDYATSTMPPYAIATIHSKTVAVDTTVNRGEFIVYSGGTAINTFAAAGTLLRASGGVLKHSVLSGDLSYLTAYDGIALDTIVSSGGIVAMRGGTVKDTTVLSGGRITEGQGVLAGRLYLEEGAIVSVKQIDFTVADQRPASHSDRRVAVKQIDFTVADQQDPASALITNWNYISGCGTYTLTVNADQDFGKYVLATGASDFDCTVFVRTTSGVELGTLSVGGVLKTEKTNYVLKKESDTLLFWVDSGADLGITISGNPATWTKNDITLVADFTAGASGIAKQEYRINDGEWQNYMQGVVMTQNGTVTFRAVDNAGNETMEVVIVDKIDKVNPTITVSGNPTDWTKSATLTAMFADDASGIKTKEYSLDGNAWKTYSSAITVTQNGTVYFKATDNAGNTAMTSIVIEKVDAVLPTITVSGNATNWTNQNVTLGADFADDLSGIATQQYRINDGAWQFYTQDIVMTQNGTVAFHAIDNVGNVATKSVGITKIDTVLPTITVSGNPTRWTKSATLTAAFADDASGIAKKEYSFDGKSWETYSSGVTVTENGTVYFKATDNAGNTATQSVDVSKIGVDPADDDWGNIKSKGAQGRVGLFSEHLQMTDRYQEFLGDGDLVDYLAFTLDNAANVSFTVSSQNAAKFTINTLTGTKGKYALKVNQTTSVGVGKSVTTKQLLLEKGTYYIGIAATDKKADSASYMIEVDPSTIFFTKGDNTDDWTDMKTSGADGAVGEWDIAEELSDWVGYGDAIDYKAIHLDHAAKASFTILSGDATKVTLCQLVKTEKKGVVSYSLKSLQSTTAKLDKKTGEYSATGKDLLLTAGDYFVAVESTNAKKGGNAEYSVSYNEIVSYDRGDNSDDWTDMKTSGADGAVGEWDIANELSDWVGFGDAIDYKAIHLDHAAKASFTILSGDATKVTLYQLVKTEKKGVVSYSLKSLQSTTAKLDKKTGEYSATGKDLLLTAGDYFVAVESTNAKKGGNAEYSVSYNEIDSYNYGNNEDDWTDMKTSGASGLSASVGSVTKESGELLTDWVGFGDAIDYKAFTLDSAANLVFDLNVTDAAKFTIYSLQSKTDKKGVTTYSLKSLQSTSIKSDASTKSLLLEKGTYYMAMESTNAKKGGSVKYSVSVNKTSKFFPAATDNNTWNDATPLSGDKLTGWVSFDDKADFWEIQLPEAGKLTLDFDEPTLNAAKHNEIKITCLDDKGKSVSLVWNGNTMQSKKEITSACCYVGITCANEKKFDTMYKIKQGFLA